MSTVVTYNVHIPIIVAKLWMVASSASVCANETLAR